MQNETLARSWNPLPLLVGLGLVLAACAAAMVIYWLDGVESFPEILYACSRNGMGLQECGDLAYKAGITSFVLRVGVFILLLGGVLWLARVAPPPVFRVSQEAKRMLVVAVLLVLVVHIVRAVLMLPVSSRIEEIRRFSFFISAENAVWPLLLHLYVTEDDATDRLILLSVLASVVLLTPYRAVGVAIVVFGFMLPLAAEFWNMVRQKTLRAKWRSWFLKAALACLVTLSIGVQGLIDTASRTAPVLLLSDLPKEMAKEIKEATDTRMSSGEDGMIGESHKPRFHQRLIYPIVQAGIIEHLAKTEKLPGPLVELKRKFRLTNDENLNEYVYKRIYGGKGVGETTSLVYGEALAYFPDFALGWMLFVPVSLIGLWYFLRRKGIDVATIAGIALWRSSFAGLVTVLPGVALQIGLLGGLVKAVPFLKRHGAQRAWLNRIALKAIPVFLAMLAVAQTALVFGFLLSAGSVEAMVTVGGKGCFFDRGRIDSALQEVIDGRFRYDVTYITQNLLSFVVPAGKGSDARIGQVLDAMNKGVGCAGQDRPPEKRKEVTIVKKIDIESPINVINILSLAAIIATLIKIRNISLTGFSWRSFFRRKHVRS